MEADDLEELKMIREAKKRREAIDNRHVVGYKFTLQSTKKKVVKENLPGMRHEIVKTIPKVESKDEEGEDEMAKVMGFSGFGRTKVKSDVLPSRPVVDLEKLTADAVLLAKDRTKKSHDNISDEVGGSGSHFEKLDGSEDDSDESDGDFIGPPMPPIAGEKNSSAQEKTEINSEDDEDYDVDGGDGSNRYSRIPISHEVKLVHGSKMVSALAIDPNGSRVVSGGVDYEVRFWDFQGMDSNLQSFRTITPCECHPIKNLEFSSNGEMLLVIAGNCQAKVVDRDGFVKMTCIKGDQYIRDMNNTKGHIGMLNYGMWNPNPNHGVWSEEFITSSIDGTMRVWNFADQGKQTSVIKLRNQGGLKANPLTCSYSRDGGLVAAGCNDGSVQAWDHRRKSYINTCMLIRNAHENNGGPSGLSFSYGGNYLATRGLDETLKLWDLRSPKTSVHTATDLLNRFENTDCGFSPDDKILFTGTSHRKGHDPGKFKFFNVDTFEMQSEMNFDNLSIVRSLWHPKLNQIIFTTNEGVVSVFYDTQLSERGAKLCVGKSKKKYRDSYDLVQPQIIAPHSLPLFKQERKKSHKVRMIKDRNDPVKSHRPELPMSGPGAGGRLASAGSTYASFIARNIATKNKRDETEDPRQALLKHAKDAEENPYWVAPAYSRTQPNPIFQNQNQDDEDDEDEPKKKKHVPV